MSSVNEDLAWALYSLAHAGCYDDWSAGPSYRTISDRGYKRANERFQHLAEGLE